MAVAGTDQSECADPVAFAITGTLAQRNAARGRMLLLGWVENAGAAEPSDPNSLQLITFETMVIRKG